MNAELVKYPSTPHVEGSKLSQGDSEIVSFNDLAGKYLMVEEKVDGCCVAVSFDDDLNMKLQSRGHFLTGGDRSQFDQFKAWASAYKEHLFDILDTRYIMYGEWMGVLHSVFYDNLPDYFMEFDIYDKQEKVFLDTWTRHEMLNHKDVEIYSVKVLGGLRTNHSRIPEYITESWFISNNAMAKLIKELDAKRIPEEQRQLLIDLNQGGLMEGVYLKWEDDGIVKGRYKYVRPEFIQTIQGSEHWLDRPIIRNGVRS